MKIISRLMNLILFIILLYGGLSQFGLSKHLIFGVFLLGGALTCYIRILRYDKEQDRKYEQEELK